MDYTNKDYSSIYSEIISNIASLTSDYVPTNNDIGIMLAKTIATVGDKLNYNIDKVASSLDLYNNDSYSTRDLLNILGYKMKGCSPASVTLTVKNKGDKNITVSKYQKFVGSTFVLISDKNYTIAPGFSQDITVYNGSYMSSTLTKVGISAGTQKYKIPNSYYLWQDSLVVKDINDILWNNIRTEKQTDNLYDLTYIDGEYYVVTTGNSNLNKVEFISVTPTNLSDITNYSVGSFLNDQGTVISDLSVVGYYISSSFELPENNIDALMNYHNILYNKTLINKIDFVKYLLNNKNCACLGITSNDDYILRDTESEEDKRYDLSKKNGMTLSVLDNAYCLFDNENLTEELSDKKYMDLDIGVNTDFYFANWYLSGNITLQTEYSEAAQNDLFINICNKLSLYYSPSNVGFGMQVKLDKVKELIYSVSSDIKDLDIKINYKYTSPRYNKDLFTNLTKNLFDYSGLITEDTFVTINSYKQLYTKDADADTYTPVSSFIRAESFRNDKTYYILDSGTSNYIVYDGEVTNDNFSSIIAGGTDLYVINYDMDTDYYIKVSDTEYSMPTQTIDVNTYLNNVYKELNYNCDKDITYIINYLINTDQHWNLYKSYKVNETGEREPKTGFGWNLDTSIYYDENNIPATLEENSHANINAKDKINPCDFLAQNHPYREVTIQRLIGYGYTAYNDESELDTFKEHLMFTFED